MSRERIGIVEITGFLGSAMFICFNSSPGICFGTVGVWGRGANELAPKGFGSSKSQHVISGGHTRYFRGLRLDRLFFARTHVV